MKQQATGFSLIELIMVIFIAGAIMLVLANLTPTFKLLSTSNQENLARQIVAEKIEDIRSAGYDNLANGDESFSDPRLTQLPQGNAEINIGDCPAQLCQNGEETKQINITVNWYENDQDQSFSVSTLISKGGIR
jgi:type II secretory pathway pseudopilin PulG